MITILLYTHKINDIVDMSLLYILSSSYCLVGAGQIIVRCYTLYHSIFRTNAIFIHSKKRSVTYKEGIKSIIK